MGKQTGRSKERKVFQSQSDANRYILYRFVTETDIPPEELKRDPVLKQFQRAFDFDFEILKGHEAVCQVYSKTTEVLFNKLSQS